MLFKQIVSFEKVKLTNNEMDKCGHVSERSNFMGIQGVYDKVAHFECEWNVMALRENNFRHIIRKNKK